MTTIDPNLQETPYALQQHLGFYLTEWRKDFCRLEQPLEPYLMNRQGIPHGGIHATLLDTAMGYCGCFTGKPEERIMALTLNLSVNYIGQAKGTHLIAEATRTGGGFKTFFAESRIKDNNDNLIATATGVFKYRR